MEQLIFGSEHLAAKEDALGTFRNAGCKVEPVWMHAEYTHSKHWPNVRQSYYLIDDRILVQQYEGEDVAVDDQWYAFNDPACVEFLERHELPSSI